jgi:hypothetical protein
VDGYVVHRANNPRHQFFLDRSRGRGKLRQ